MVQHAQTTTDTLDPIKQLEHYLQAILPGLNPLEPYINAHVRLAHAQAAHDGREAVRCEQLILEATQTFETRRRRALDAVRDGLALLPALRRARETTHKQAAQFHEAATRLEALLAPDLRSTRSKLRALEQTAALLRAARCVEGDS